MNPLLLYVPISLLAIALYALLAVYAERKVAAYIQDRLGPTEVGPYGLFQTLADIVKLLSKEAIVPAQADRRLFALAPPLIFVSVFTAFALLPWGANFGASELSSGLLLVFGIASIDVLGLIVAGWGSHNKYALLGAARAAAQIISYEIPASLALLSAVMMFGTFSLAELSVLQGTLSQEPLYFWGLWEINEIGGITAWAIFRYPHLIIAYIVYFIAALAECNRAPFDIPEAEGELVAGYHVEYGGFRFALIFLGEYAKMLLVSLLAAVVFFGAWNTPFPNLHFGSLSLPLADWTTGSAGTVSAMIWGVFWLLLKGALGVFLQMWIRWTYPRLRVDQLMQLCWKVLTPIGFVLMLISGFWKLAEVGGF